MRLDNVLTAIGRTFISAGVLVFLFVAYQLWGTGLTETRSQQTLVDDFNKALSAPTTSVPPSGSTPTTAPVIPTGEAVAIIQIPKINMQKAVVEGTGVPDLKKGPGHYKETPMPGQHGNVGIAGHRTTYGAPFGDLGLLAAGDDIQLTTRQGNFFYKVSSTEVVDPSNISVLNPTGIDMLTLTTCHPKYSAAKRLIVHAVLKSSAPTGSTPTSTTTTTAPKNGATTTSTTLQGTSIDGASLSGEAIDKTPAIAWGIVCTVFALFAWMLSRRYNKWLIYILATPIFLVLLFFFFENFSRLLPANA